MTRQGTHLRGRRISGDSNRLNDKAIKVLSAIKFSSTSITREEIKEKTGLTIEDVERQTKLLLNTNLILLNSRFPRFPEQGWRVYTKREDHIKITRILKAHGIEDPIVEKTKALLGNYYPTGLDLEGNGRQPNRGFTYTKGHPIIPELEFRLEAIAVMEKFRDEIKPFRPKVFSNEALEEKKQKWKWFVEKMSEAYRIPTPTIKFGIFNEESWNRIGSSANDDRGQSSYYSPSNNTLFFTGKFSLTTLLHEYGHARGFDERDTIIWSINIGLRFFPVTYNRLIKSSEGGSHMLTQSSAEDLRFNF